MNSASNTAAPAAETLPLLAIAEHAARARAAFIRTHRGRTLAEGRSELAAARLRVARRRVLTSWTRP